MANSGLSGSFTFGGTVYDTDDCIQSMALTRTTNGVKYICGGITKTAAGESTYSFSASVALAQTDTAKVAALANGATGAFEYHPKGDTATYIEETSTNGTIVQSNMGSAPGAMIMLDIVIDLDDLTDAAAA